ncbi:MAG: metallophosphoesterase [Candidatus Omnitrophica bacterium]|nr:metallophosphoesterase [Candidatus Omnitrophota bacterium]
MKDNLKMLVIGDIHYSAAEEAAASAPGRHAKYGLELLTRALRRFAGEEKPDVLVILGDVTDSGGRQEANDAMIAVEKSGIPAVIIPGNHDAPGGRPKPLPIKNFLLYPFVDSYQEDDKCTRREEDIEKFRLAVKNNPGKKIIALQHNPVYPMIEDDYPYNLRNAYSVHRAYAENNVILSLSGHYHPGKNLTYKSGESKTLTLKAFQGRVQGKNGVGYFTVPALCESPFRYAVIEVRGDKISADEYALRNPVPLCDNHCHTQFAYCAEDVTVEKVLERASLLGMDYVCFTEHADQLYLTREEYSRMKYLQDAGILISARKNGTDRVKAFREAVKQSGSAMAKAGLEVCPDASGGITLLPEDREGLDMVIGAIHFLPGDFSHADEKEVQRGFMQAFETLVNNDIDVLAHPFRLFSRSGLKPPRDLFRPVAGMLKNFGVAAELNFHTNKPSPEFFEICLREGIKISLGTDTHNLLQAGEFCKHLEFLKMLGISTEQIGKILYLLS